MQILFLGPPGSGKGTQCKKVAQRLKVPHLSSGDLLRVAISSNTPTGIAAKEYMDKGQLVPDQILFAMFEEKLAESECQTGFVLDGFPRNLAQATELDRLLPQLKLPLTVVIYLHLADALLEERITSRLTCPNKKCGAVYHAKFAPPKADNVCDLCGTQLVQRSDDRADLVRTRLAVYHEQTKPLIEYYEAKGILKKIDAQGEPEKIFGDILNTLQAQI